MFIEPGYVPIPPVVERPKTRKELREERIKQEKMQKEAQLEAEKQIYERQDDPDLEEDDEEIVQDVKNIEEESRENSDGIKFEDMYVGKLIDVIDYMSKWRNSIVQKVDKKGEKITVIMESGLELELTKDDIDNKGEEVIAKFESKTDPCSPDKIEKLNEILDETSNLGNSDIIITRKSSRTKRQTNKVIASTTDENEKKGKQIDLDLAEVMKPTPIIKPKYRESTSRKKQKKAEGLAKQIDPSPQVDNKNFPELGSIVAVPGNKTKSTFGHQTSVDQNIEDASSKSKPLVGDKDDDNSEEEKNEKSSASNVIVTPSSTPDIADEYKLLEVNKKRKQNLNALPEPKEFKNGVTVLDLLKRSYETMTSDFEECKDNLFLKETNKQKLVEGYAEKCSVPKTPSLNIPKLINKFSDSTLFFIFYYQQGTSSQILAAEELSKRNWHFLPKYQTWFKDKENGSNPAQRVTSGEGFYFDFSSDWKTKPLKYNPRQN